LIVRGKGLSKNDVRSQGGGGGGLSSEDIFRTRGGDSSNADVRTFIGAKTSDFLKSMLCLYGQG